MIADVEGRVMIIRNATKDDLPGILPLLAELGYPTSLDILTVRFEKFLMHANYGVALCELDHQILGFVAWTKATLFVLDADKFHIEALVVATEHRGCGIGEKLMRFVEEIAKASSPSIIDLTSGVRRAKDGTHAFYKRLGYKNEGHMAKLYLRKEL